MSASKKTQLRLCAFCHKPGHNKATCPDFKITPPMSKKPPVRVVIHERPQTIARSPHLLNLKKQENPWQKINTASPEKNTSLYYRYHELGKQQNKLAPKHKKQKIEKVNIKIAIDKKVKKDKKVKINLKQFFQKNWAALKGKFSFQKIRLRFRQNNPKKIQIIKQWFLNYLASWKSSGRPAFILAMAILLLVVCPLQAHTFYQNLKSTTRAIAVNGTEGFLALQESTAAIMQADLTGAEASTNNALNKLNNAVNILNTNHKFLLKIISAVPIISNEVQSRQNIITAGQKIAQGNTFLIKGIHASQENPDDSLTKRIAIVTKYLQAALPNYQAALKDLSRIDPNVLPVQFQAPFKDFKLLFTAVLGDLNILSDLGQSIQEIFGGQGLRRYLLIFQNPHEIRPTGGFIGSFALIDIKNGKMVNLEVPAGGSYDLQGQLDQFVEPPTPLLLANKRWEFQDANWFPDFPASAKKILWFYRHSRQLTADGVIAINATVLERLLAIVGPIIDEKRSLTLTSNNAITTIQKIVEEGPEKQIDKPKQILADLAPKLLDYLIQLKPGQAMPLLLSMSEALEQKEIQTYFTDEETQKNIASFGWAGQILPTQTDQDYLFVVNTNIRGEKSDAEIKQSIAHQAVVQENGEIVNMVTITKEHLGTRGEKLYGQTNIDYLRIYVPEGSELISISGFTWPDETRFRAPDKWAKKDEFLNNIEKEIKIDDSSGTRVTSEFGKTAFGNWIITEPGQTSQIQFTYRLPFRVFGGDKQTSVSKQKLFDSNSHSSRYQLVVQRQSGVESDFESQIIFPASWQAAWNDGQNSSLALNGMTIAANPLKKDSVWSLLMRQKQ